MQQKNRKERTAEKNEPPSTEEYWRKFYSPLSNFSFLNSKQKFEHLQYEWFVFDISSFCLFKKWNWLGTIFQLKIFWITYLDFFLDLIFKFFNWVLEVVVFLKVPFFRFSNLFKIVSTDFSRDPLFPSNIKLINIDINETVISFMNQRQKFVCFVVGIECCWLNWINF